MTTTTWQRIGSILVGWFLLSFQNLIATDGEFRYVIKHLDVAQGLLHTDATCSVQDRDGFMWIGTLAGLHRYDGYELKVYQNELDPLNRVYHNRILAMSTDLQGRIWMTTYGDLSCFDPRTEQYLPVLEGYPQLKKALFHANAFYIDQANHLFISTKTQTWAFTITDDGTLLPFSASLGYRPLMEIGVHGFDEDESGRVFLVSQNGIFSCRDGEMPESFLDFADLAEVPEPSWPQILIESQKMYVSIGHTIYQIETEAPVDPHTSSIPSVKILPHQINFANASCGIDLRYEKWVITRLFADSQGALWIGTTHGLIKAEGGSDQGWTYHCLRHIETDPYSLNANHINSIYMDDSEVLWIGTWGGGMNLLDLNQQPFYLLRRDPMQPQSSLSDVFIRAVVEDQHGNLWIGTREQGLNYYNRQTGTFQHFKHKAGVQNGLIDNGIKCLMQASEDQLWIGTNTGICIMDTRSQTFEPFMPEEGSIKLEAIYSLAQDRFGNIWAGSWSRGLFRIEPQEDGGYSISSIHNYPQLGQHIVSKSVTFIHTDSVSNDVWIGTQQGLYRILLTDHGDLSDIQLFQGVNGKAGSLTSNFIWPIVKQNDSVLWVGTLGGGLNKVVIHDTYIPGELNYHATAYSQQNGAPFDDIESLEIDDAGKLWLAGRGLARFDPLTEEFVLYEEKDGLQGNSFKIGASHKGRNGMLYFGGTQGMSYFNPQQIHQTHRCSHAAISKLVVNNKEIATIKRYGEEVLLPQSINHIEHLKLSHLDNNFAFYFASFHYSNPEKSYFRYKLEGYDHQWVYAQAGNPMASYANLDYGDYTFVLQTSNQEGVWSEEAAQVKLTIVPPWYQTTLAKALFALTLVGLFLGILVYLINWQRLKRDLTIAQIEEKKKEEMHQMRLQFFTNISHEFKTPLSLIISPLEKMLAQKLNPTDNHRYLNLMLDNAKRLLRLINELMEFRKLETGQTSLQVVQQDIVGFVQSVAERFDELAKSKEVTYQIQVPDYKHFIWFDPTLLENILYNLLSNAFKYSAQWDSVSIAITQHYPYQGSGPYAHSFTIDSPQQFEENIYIRISDTGKGIDRQAMPQIFDRYFRVGDALESQAMGSGIGLALVENLIRLHRAEITVYSEEHKGTEFLIKLPASQDAYPESVQTALAETSKPFLPLSTNQAHTHGPLLPESPSKGILPKLLLVEDNAAIRSYLAENLQDDFEVLEAGNGQEGLQIAINQQPHVVISDVMMPVMDGIELCEKIKGEAITQHIPVILLTAKGSQESHIQGLSSGADLYFTKPFNIGLIRLTLKNLLTHREKLREKHLTSGFLEQREEIKSEAARKLLGQITQMIDERMEDSDFDVEALCRAVGMSRTNLYYKMKDLTGKTVGEYIRHRRLRRAALTLVHQDISVAEVMDLIGIKSQSYFTRAFKKEFGKTPTQFVRDMVNQENPTIPK